MNGYFNGPLITNNGLSKGDFTMSILPEGEEIRKAVKWVSEKRTEKPEKKLSDIVEEACLKFDLSPKDAAFLFRFVTEKEK